ncbi:MAG: TonB-dependent receptor, partial [Chitinophagaceae bacterium]
MLAKKVFSILAICISPFYLHAQEAVEDTVVSRISEVQPLAPVEVRAIRAGDNAPFAKTEISGEALQKDNLGQDLPFLLQYTPSVIVNSDAGAGVGYTGIRLRGSDGTRINTTLNGIAVNDAESSSTYFVDLPDLASSTSSIQIQRGVGSSTNGASAFGGSISISNLDVNEKPNAAAAVSYGSFNTQKYTVAAGTGLLPGNVAFEVRLSRITSDGFVDRAASKLSALQLQGMWKASSKTTIKAMVLLGEEQTYQAWNGVPEEKLRGSDSALNAHYQNNIGSLYFNSNDSQNLFSANRRTYNYFTYSNQTDNYRQNYFQLFGDHNFSKKLSAHLGLFLTRGIGYYEEYKNNDSLVKYGLSPFTTPLGDTMKTTDLVRQLWLDNYNYGAVYSLLWNPSRALNFTFGGGWSQYQGNHYGRIIWAQYGVPNHYQWYKLDAQKNDFNLYSKAEIKLSKKLTGYADAQIRTIGYFMNGFRENPNLKPAVTYTFFNPKAGLNYILQSNVLQTQRLYASVAVANKEPNRDDFEADSNQLPKPERLIDAEAGYAFQNDEWKIGVNAYYMRYKDQLILTGKVNDVGAYTRVNVPKSYRAGLEAEAAWKPLSWLVLNTNATFSQNKIESFTEYVDNYDDNSQLSIEHKNTDIAFSANLIAAGGASFSPFRQGIWKAFSAEILGKYVSRQYLDNTSNNGRSLDPYALCDLRLRYTF